MLRIKHAYDRPVSNDGYRILVDRCWPRRVSRNAACIDFWFKEAAPSDALRKWFNQNPTQWDLFRKRYFNELWRRPEEIKSILELLRKGVVTLVYTARNRERNQAVALREFVLEVLKELDFRRRPKRIISKIRRGHKQSSPAVKA